jgi:type I restriction-modification system DNA methylase subunit
VDRIFSLVPRLRGCGRDREGGHARLTSAANDYNLNITRYIERKSEEKVLSVEEAMEQLQLSAQAAFEAEQKLIDVLTTNGLLVTNPK